MKKLVELARQIHLGRSYSEVAGSLGMARPTVRKAMRRLRSANVSWPTIGRWKLTRHSNVRVPSYRR
jgi:hypothetical protein